MYPLRKKPLLVLTGGIFALVSITQGITTPTSANRQQPPPSTSSTTTTTLSTTTTTVVVPDEPPLGLLADQLTPSPLQTSFEGFIQKSNERYFIAEVKRQEEAEKIRVWTEAVKENERRALEEAIKAKEEAEKLALETQVAGITQDAVIDGQAPPPLPGECPAPTGDSLLQPWPSVVRTMVMNQFGITNIGGTRPGDPRDHGKGLALDVMVPISSPLGDDVAAWAVQNKNTLNISYVIWKQQIYTTARPYWRWMSDRGSITQNHYDHVHISFNPGNGTCG